MSFMFEWLAFGTLGFWFVVGVAFTLITILVEAGREASPTVVTLISLGIIDYFGGVPIYYWLVHNPLSALALIFVYFLIGAGFSIIKWRLHLTKLVRQVKENGGWQGEGDYRRRGEVPTASDFKSLLVNWIIYWPFSGSWTLIKDPVVRIGRLVYTELVKVYDSMAAKAFKDINPNTR